MEREIKFRAFIKSKDRMGIDCLTLFDIFRLSRETDAQFDEDDHIVMQYTGLNDKNGVEIYEGDICRVTVDECESTTHEVRYRAADCDYPAFDYVPELGCDSNGLSWSVCAIDYTTEVIGNIYENPELLKP